MVAKDLTALVRALRRLGVQEYRAEGLHLVLGPPPEKPARRRRTNPKAKADDAPPEPDALFDAVR